jgi:hypothetical protein
VARAAKSSSKRAKPSSTGKSARSRLRALPWAGIAQAGLVVGRRVTDLSAKDRARLGRLLRQSRGWPGRLAPKERDELRRLLGKLEPRSISRELAPLLRTGGRRRHR